MKQFIPKESFKNWLLLIISLGIAVYFYPSLPEQIATHFNFEGKIDGYGSKLTIFMGPAIILAMIIGGEITRRVDPRKANYPKFMSTYYWMFFVIGLVMLVTQIISILVAKNVAVDVSKIMMGSMAVLFIVLGNMMPKIKHNYSTGFKTPWTIADERVWYLTHRLGGKCMLVGGLIFILAIFLPSHWRLTIFILSMFISVLVPTIASYFYYQKYHQESH